jgi:hypothetical protein
MARNTGPPVIVAAANHSSTVATGQAMAPRRTAIVALTPSPASRLVNTMPQELPPQRQGCAQSNPAYSRTSGGGKRIREARRRIGAAVIALPTMRLAGASGVGWTPDAPVVWSGAECDPKREVPRVRRRVTSACPNLALSL